MKSLFLILGIALPPILSPSFPIFPAFAILCPPLFLLPPLTLPSPSPPPSSLPLPPPPSPSSLLPQVLSVEPSRQRVYLTHKKTLVDSSLPVLSSYDQAKPGGVHHGFIRNIFTSSCLVEFFNHVKGKVHRSDLGCVVPSMHTLYMLYPLYTHCTCCTLYTHTVHVVPSIHTRCTCCTLYTHTLYMLYPLYTHAVHVVPSTRTLYMLYPLHTHCTCCTFCTQSV